MNPQQPSPNPGNGTPLDYLNQIATPAPQKGVGKLISGPLQPIHYIIGGLLLLVVIVIVLSIVMGVVNGNTNGKIQRLSARLDATAVIVNDSTAKIKSSQLRAINSNLKLLVTNTTRDIAGPIGTVGIDLKNIPKDIKSEESADKASARLEDARLNGLYDSTYTREMAYQLTTTLSLMKEIYNATNNSALKTALQTAYANLEPTAKQLSEFTTQTE